MGEWQDLLGDAPRVRGDNDFGDGGDNFGAGYSNLTIRVG